MLRFHEIAETYHRILNPFTEEQLDLLGDVAGVTAGQRHLDLCCGKGEMLCRWARRYGISAVGVDLSRVFLDAARARAAELGVEEKVTFVEADAATYTAAPGSFDVVSCIGASWIGNGLAGTLAIQRRPLAPGGTILTGEPFFHTEPPEDVARRLSGGAPDLFTTLAGTLDRFEAADLELVEMVLAHEEGWDRYEAPRWRALVDFLDVHPDDPDAGALRRWLHEIRREYVEVGRRYLGWGVFVLRPRA